MRRAIILVAAAILTLSGADCLNPPDGTDSDDQMKPVGLIQLIEFEDTEGLMNWGYELQQRGLKSLACIQKNMVEAYPTEIKWLADQGHEIAGGYAEQAFWELTMTPSTLSCRRPRRSSNR
jgi:hypothetical protein